MTRRYAGFIRGISIGGKRYRLQRAIAADANEKVTTIANLKSRVIKYPLFEARVCVSQRIGTAAAEGGLLWEIAICRYILCAIRSRPRQKYLLLARDRLYADLRSFPRPRSASKVSRRSRCFHETSRAERRVLKPSRNVSRFTSFATRSLGHRVTKY